MTIETKEASPPGGAECPPPPPPRPTVSAKRRNRTHLRQRPKLKVKQTATNHTATNTSNGDCCGEGGIESFEEISTDMKNCRIPANGVIDIPSFTGLELLATTAAASLGDKSPTPSSSSSGESGTGSQTVVTPISNVSSRKRGTKRSKKVKDGPPGDSSSDSRSVIVPCRKSKRLLFKNNNKAIAEKRLNGEQSDSISPYGRLVELIDHEPQLDRDDFLTKCLFLGNLDLTFADPGANQQPITNNTDAKTGIRPSSSSSTAKNIFNPQSLKTLCILNIVKRKKQEFDQRELEYLRQVDKSNTNDDSDDPDSWLNFGEYVTNLTKTRRSSSDSGVISPVSLDECVEKLYRCGTEITFSGASSGNGRRMQNHRHDITKSGTSTDDDDDGKWFNWGEHMTKVLQIDVQSRIISKKVAATGRGEDASIKQKSRKVSRRKQTVRA